MNAGFQQMGDSNVFRFTAVTLNSPMPQHNVFVSVETSGVEVMSPVGPADDYNPTDFEVARNPDDGYELAAAGSQVALTRLLDDDAVRADPQHIFDSAAYLAEYAGYVEHTLKQNRVRKFELAEKIGLAVTDPEYFASSSVAPSELVAELEEAFRLIPVKGFWEETVGRVNQSLMNDWASHSGTMRDSPWYQVKQALETIGAQRHWQIK